jgi:hypothetical protein
MNNQEILKLKIAPVFVSVKIFKGDTGYNPTTKHYRSLADINRIVELEKALDKIIDRAQQVDGWESFPESWIDEAYEALKEPKL